MNNIISSRIEELVSKVYCNEGIDSGETEEESGNQQTHLQYKVWIPETTDTSLTSEERLTISDRLQRLYEHTASDQDHLKRKFMQIGCDDTTDNLKPEIDPYEAASIKDLSATRIDLVPNIISECQGRTQIDADDGDEIEKYGVISLQEWKKALKVAKKV